MLTFKLISNLGYNNYHTGVNVRQQPTVPSSRCLRLERVIRRNCGRLPLGCYSLVYTICSRSVRFQADEALKPCEPMVTAQKVEWRTEMSGQNLAYRCVIPCNVDVNQDIKVFSASKL